jgi:hypothetical protein
VVIADLTSIKNEKIELLIQLKNNPLLSLVPFLLITGKSGETGQKMKDHFITKPFTKDFLIEKLKKILNPADSTGPW